MVAMSKRALEALDNVNVRVNNTPVGIKDDREA